VIFFPQLFPMQLNQRRRAIHFEVFAVGEVAVEVEVIDKLLNLRFQISRHQRLRRVIVPRSSRTF
jgi:hypothetical protein